jgi:hypothetical protein
MVMKRIIHAVAGSVAMMSIAAFWTATVATELAGDAALIASVKQGVLVGMAVLVPALMATGGSGFALAKSWRGRVVEAKKKRMMLAAANGLLILLPSAVLLATWSSSGRFDDWFVAVQSLELAAGATNFVLLGLNMRDGLRMRSRRLAERTIPAM